MTTRADDFERSDGPLGANWEYLASFDWLEIVSGAGQTVPASAYGEAFWVADSFGDDQYSALLGVTGLNLPDVAVAAILTRWNSGRSGYNAGPYNNGGTKTVYISVTTAGTNASLAVESATFTDGDDFLFSSVGSLHSLYQNGIEVATASDATYTSGAPGFGIYSDAGPTRVPAWEGGDVVVGGGAQFMPLPPPDRCSINHARM